MKRPEILTYRCIVWSCSAPSFVPFHVLITVGCFNQPSPAWLVLLLPLSGQTLLQATQFSHYKVPDGKQPIYVQSILPKKDTNLKLSSYRAKTWKVTWSCLLPLGLDRSPALVSPEELVTSPGTASVPGASTAWSWLSGCIYPGIDGRDANWSLGYVCVFLLSHLIKPSQRTTP